MNRSNLSATLIALVLLALGWELSALLINLPVLPRLGPATASLLRATLQGDLLCHAGASLYRILVILFQVLVTVRDAAIAPGLIRSVRSLGGGEWAIYRHAVLPGMLPAIFTARRLSTGTAVAVLFFAETYATNLGLGAMIWDAWSARGYETMFAGVLAMALLGFGLYVVLDWLERLLCPWKAPAR